MRLSAELDRQRHGVDAADPHGRAEAAYFDSSPRE